jgi:glycine hydroxymethyltransferase
MIICGGSAYPRDIDYAKFRKIADDNGALLFMDMAHISGLVATGEAANPFPYCDVVTTTTHKTLRGPRAGMIFYRKDARDFENKINSSVFPGLQGGPHEHQIAAVATQLKEVATPAFKEYAVKVRSNARALANHLQTKYGFTIATGGTDNHIVLWDLKPQGFSGGKMQTICDLAGITLNKNTVLGDTSALNPGGVRLGSSALTTRGLNEADFCTVGDFLHEALQIGLRIVAANPTAKLLKDFEKVATGHEEVKALKRKVMQWVTRFPMPGFDTTTMRYQDITNVAFA